MYDERSWIRVGVIGGLLALFLVGWFVIVPALDDGDRSPAISVVEADESPSTVSADEMTSVAPASADRDEEVSATTLLGEPEDGAESTSIPTTNPTRPDGSAPGTQAPTSSLRPTQAATTTAPATTTTTTTTTAPATTTTTASTTAPATTTTTEEGSESTATSQPASDAIVQAPFDTLPDGSPAPVVAVYQDDQISLFGAVPSAAAEARLETLAKANAKPGQAETIVNSLTINTAVPNGVGVRVVETTSTRFPVSSSTILPPHAAELDRAVTIMKTLPNVTALVIGHADQRGDELSNFELSAQRAEAVVNYMVAEGIAPDRLSSRAVGESDLLTLNSDAVSLALNRRTEFVFYGLLVV